MSKTIVIFGATGVQGGGVVKELLKDKTWKIRGVTRNTSSSSAQALSSQGVEMVTADLEDLSSLTNAFSVHLFPNFASPLCLTPT